MEEKVVLEAVKHFRSKVYGLSVNNLPLPKREKREGKKRDRIKASSLGNCPIAIRLEMNGETPVFDAFVLKRMAEGTAIHELFQSITASFWDEMEKRYTDDQLVGHVDARTGNAIVEIKSTSLLPDAPDSIWEKYWYQIGAYLRLSGAEQAFFIFIDKADLSNVAVFRIDGREKLIKMVEDKIQQVFSTDLNDTSLIGTDCKGCSFSHVCPALKLHEENSLAELDEWIGIKP